jgi:hypothetical protein
MLTWRVLGFKFIGNFSVDWGQLFAVSTPEMSVKLPWGVELNHDEIMFLDDFGEIAVV